MEDFEVDVEVKQTYRISVKVKTIEEAKELARVNALKVAILARALISVDNEPVGNVGETAELLNKMQPMIINRLYDEYDNMISEQENALADLDELKNSSKTTSRESNTK